MSAYILFQKDNTISSWARAGYLKSTRQLSRWANGCGQDFSQLRGEQLETLRKNRAWCPDCFADSKHKVRFRQQCMIVPGNHALLPKAYKRTPSWSRWQSKALIYSK